jgi:hypothetical protein
MPNISFSISCIPGDDTLKFLMEDTVVNRGAKSPIKKTIECTLQVQKVIVCIHINQAILTSLVWFELG